MNQNTTAYLTPVRFTLSSHFQFRGLALPEEKLVPLEVKTRGKSRVRISCRTVFIAKLLESLQRPRAVDKLRHDIETGKKYE